MDLVFMGTPDFAVISLNKLNNGNHINIKYVVTQPDQARGRGQRTKPSPVKKRALELGLNILDLKIANTPEFIKVIEKIKPDFIVVVAFGQKLNNEILSLPGFGCINLHASLLPRYRGASPINQAIINGDKYTGVTTMFMDEGLDTGDILLQEKVEINNNETAGDLHDKLANVGAGLLLRTLLEVKKGTVKGKKQDDKLATYTYKMKKEMGKINWNSSADVIFNLIRGVNPWPGAYTYFNGKILKILKASLIDKNSVIGEPGLILVSPDEELIIQTASGLIKIERLQLAGKRIINASDFLHGYFIPEDTKLE
jgi:methionyl-tRNA formyltransferase